MLPFSPFPFFYVFSDAVNLLELDDYLNSALGLGTGSIGGGVIATLLLSMLMIVPLMYFMKGKNLLLSIIIAYGSMLFGTAVGWIPSWIIILLIVLTAALLGGVVRDWITGKGTF